jgi:hypothetical protein
LGFEITDMYSEKLIKEEKGNIFLADSIGVNLPPMTITISDPTGEILGEFKEKDGLLTFKGRVDDAGKVFVDFICETFKQ